MENVAITQVLVLGCFSSYHSSCSPKRKCFVSTTQLNPTRISVWLRQLTPKSGKFAADSVRDMNSMLITQQVEIKIWFSQHLHEQNPTAWNWIWIHNITHSITHSNTHTRQFSLLLIVLFSLVSTIINKSATLRRETYIMNGSKLILTSYRTFSFPMDSVLAYQIYAELNESSIHKATQQQQSRLFSTVFGEKQYQFLHLFSAVAPSRFSAFSPLYADVMPHRKFI